MAERKERVQEAYRTTPPSSDTSDALQQGAEALLQVRDGAAATATYTAGVLRHFLLWTKTFLRLMQKPLGALLFLYVLAATGLHLTAQLRSTILAPVCAFPGATVLLPICARFPGAAPPARTGAPGPAQQADFPALAALEDAALSPLLASSAGGSALALELKRAELATADLRTLVAASQLDSRAAIAEQLRVFHDDARIAGRSLHAFGAKVGGAVDSVLAVHDYAAARIAAAPDASLLSGVLPWQKTKERVAVAEFGRSMDVLGTQLARLVLEAETNIAALDALEEHLRTLAEILQRERDAHTESTDELLGELWTMLGGNRKEVRNARLNGALLRELGKYRRAARAHVAAALQTLLALEADMSELRARVAAPALVGADVPVEVHMNAIRAGVERLKDGRLRARELEQAGQQKVLDAAGLD
jgi:hypothetical protein